jgi:hypothetical protein
MDRNGDYVGAKTVKPRKGNGQHRFLDVAAPLSVPELRKAAGIKPSNIRRVSRIFAELGIEKKR